MSQGLSDRTTERGVLWDGGGGLWRTACRSAVYSAGRLRMLRLPSSPSTLSASPLLLFTLTSFMFVSFCTWQSSLKDLGGQNSVLLPQRLHEAKAHKQYPALTKEPKQPPGVCVREYVRVSACALLLFYWSALSCSCLLGAFFFFFHKRKKPTQSMRSFMLHIRELQKHALLQTKESMQPWLTDLNIPAESCLFSLCACSEWLRAVAPRWGPSGF